MDQVNGCFLDYLWRNDGLLMGSKDIYVSTSENAVAGSNSQ